MKIKLDCGTYEVESMNSKYKTALSTEVETTYKVVDNNTLDIMKWWDSPACSLGMHRYGSIVPDDTNIVEMIDSIKMEFKMGAAFTVYITTKNTKRNVNN